MNPVLGGMLESKQAVPCLFYPAVREMGFSVAEVLADGAKQAEVLAGIPGRYGVGAVVRMAELWCEAAAFGMDCKVGEEDFPRLGAPLFEDPEELEEAEMPAVDSPVLAPLIEAVALAAPRLAVPLVVGVTGPYTLGAVLNGSEDFMVNCMTEPEAVHTFLEKLTAFLRDYAAAYKRAGAAAVMVAEPSTAMVSPGMMEEFSGKYVQRLVDELQDDGFAVIYHNCGAVNGHLASIAKLGAAGFHFGSDVDLALARAALPEGGALMGNLEPRLFLPGSGAAPQDIAAKTRQMVEQCKGLAGWIPGTGCDLAPVADMDSVRAFVAAAGR